MMPRAVSFVLACCCLLLALSACGNKGPLVPAEQEKKQKTETATE